MPYKMLNVSLTQRVYKIFTDFCHVTFKFWIKIPGLTLQFIMIYHRTCILYVALVLIPSPDENMSLPVVSVETGVESKAKSFR